MELVISDDLKFILGFVGVVLFMLHFIFFVPLGYYLEFKGRYYREKWFELENKRRAEHPEQFNCLAYRIVDFFRWGRRK